MGDVEEKVRDFYDRFGWIDQQQGRGEDQMFRHFLQPYAAYHQQVNERTKSCFSGLQGNLLIAGGGDLPETHVEISEQFDSTTCLDISTAALDIAKQKLGQDGEYINASVLDIPKPAASFDAVYFAHVLYHIDKDLQHQAVNELIRVTKPGGRIIILYRNPKSIGTPLINARNRLAGKILSLLPPAPDTGGKLRLYFYLHPLSWWQQFDSLAEVDLSPWDVLSNSEEKFIFRNDFIADKAYRFCGWLEANHPKLAVRLWSYVVVTLTKRPE